MNKKELRLPRKQIQEIYKEYEFIYADRILEYDDELLNYIQAYEKLPLSDRAIMAIYAETQSQRQTAAILGVSRTTVVKCLNKIRKQIKDNLE